MKKIITLVLALGLVLGSVSVSSAADFRVGGVFDFSFGKNFNPKLTDDRKTDFTARERFRTWIDIIVSESLKGQIYLEIGENNFGNRGDNPAAGQGFSLGGDGVSIEVRRAFIDWVVPNTALQVRMGLQGIAFPMAKPGPHIAFDEDMAGISLNYRFNDMAAMNLFWAQPFNSDKADAFNAAGAYDDDMNVFGLVLPISGNGFRFTPYGAYALIGENMPGATATAGYSTKEMRLVAGGEYDYAWWAGFALSITAWDPFRLSFDAVYGDLHSQKDDKTMGTEGFWIALALDYKASWGTPGFTAWYASGDDDDEMGQMFSLSSPGAKFLSFGFDHTAMIGGGGKVFQKQGLGTWGIALQIDNISFIEKMTHLVRVAYIQGTNDKDSQFGAAYKSAGYSTGNAFSPIYMSTKDWAIEVDFNTNYAIYDNLSAFVELGMIYMDMDDHNADLDKVYDEIGWKFMVGLQYRF